LHRTGADGAERLAGFLARLAADAAYLLCLLLSFVAVQCRQPPCRQRMGLSRGPVQLAILQGYFVQLANVGQLLGLAAGSHGGRLHRLERGALAVSGRRVLAAMLFAMRPRSH
jgi:hypothetical protein